MKVASKILTVLMLGAIAISYTACKKHNDDKKTEEQVQLEKLKGSWQILTATDASGDRTGDFTDPNPALNLVLTLSGNYAEGGLYTYSFTGKRPTPSPWAESGTWQFGNPKTSKIIRDPKDPKETELSYTVTDTELTFEFIVPENSEGWPGSAGRVQSVSGTWTFTFSKL